MKIISIVGARPQFIKLGPLSHVLRGECEQKIIHTGQHFDSNMSDTFFEELELSIPDYHLTLGGGPHGAQTGIMLIEIEKILLLEKPDIVVVFGDTNTTLAGAVAASKLGIKLIHIEAGLRSFNRSMPEEINRIVADHTSDILFAPTKLAMKNLKNENLATKSFLTGDIMTDSLNFASSKAMQNSLLKDILEQCDKYYLATFHRPYNVDNPDNLKKIVEILGDIRTNVIFPVHPRTKNVLVLNNIEVGQNVFLIEPQGYFDFISLIKGASKLLTDSGGIQKEAYILGVPCLTFRSETEWVETIDVGWNKLVDYYAKDVVEMIEKFEVPKDRPLIYGSNVAIKMRDIIIEEFR